MLKEHLKQELNQSLKSGNQIKRLVLGGLLTSVKNKELAKRTQLSKTISDASELEKQSQLSDEDVLETIASEVKKRKDSIEQFKAGNRSDLAQKEESELKILISYLPQQLTEDEVREKVKEAIASLNAQSPQDLGKVIGAVMAKVKGKTDGGTVSNIAKELMVNG